MNPHEILSWLREEDPERLEALWNLANEARRRMVGEAVHIRGLIEFSNHCRSHCRYCGIQGGRTSLVRYRMTGEEILASAREAVSRGYGALVMQSGEDPDFNVDWLAEVVNTIKRDTSLAITLSCGERSGRELARLYAAGADRYYLRFETSDRRLWENIHPARSGGISHRLDLLPRIKKLGYETGSGIMVGIPGQTWASLVEDIEWFQRLDLDMIGCGPYVPHGDTPLGKMAAAALAPSHHAQVPNTGVMACKVMAVTRLLLPKANIPTTTALATLDLEAGSRTGLQRGANVLMVNLTPLKYRSLYEIYPSKAGMDESDQSQVERVRTLLSGLGRPAGEGPGTSLNYRAPHQALASQLLR